MPENAATLHAWLKSIRSAPLRNQKSGIKTPQRTILNRVLGEYAFELESFTIQVFLDPPGGV